jgi:phospholipid/cholesterol/gamma-HCH transport system ATP-binding protein
MSDAIIDIKGLKNYLGGQWVHTDVNLTVQRGEILGIIGGSGSGKTTILRCILMLLKPTAGSIRVFNQDIESLDEQQANALRRRWGMLFQHSALFSALSVLENIAFPIHELTPFNPEFITKLARLKLTLVGLDPSTGDKFPAELSGGMQRRVAAARAIAMDPELLFLDEPTSGLDPLSAKQFDHLIVFLRKALDLTLVIVSHDMDSLRRTTDRVAFVGDGRIISVEPLDKLMKNDHPLISKYFSQM